jgi:hypothetical protein
MTLDRYGNMALGSDEVAEEVTAIPRAARRLARPKRAVF